MKHIFILFLILCLGQGDTDAQTAPIGSDNQGGVACPAGTYAVTPNIPLVSLNAYTANATREVDDLSVASVSEIGLNWIRLSNTRSPGGSQWLGKGGNWRHSFQWDFTQITVGGVPTINVVYPDGRANSFTQTSPSVWTSTNAVTDVITRSGPNFILTNSSLQQYVFNSSGQLTSIIDSRGQTTTLTYTTVAASGADPAYTGITKVTDASGRYLTISYTCLPTEYAYDSETRSYFYPTGTSLPCISKVTSSDGRNITYSYGAFSWEGALPAPVFGNGYEYINYLQGGTYTDGTECAYSYEQLTVKGTPIMTEAIDPRTPGVEDIEYNYFSGASDPLGAVKTVSEGSSGTLICTVSLVGGNTQTPEVTFPDGSYFSYNVAAGGLLNSVTNALNKSESFTYNLGSGTRTIAVQDSNLHTTSTTWATTGQIMSRTYPPVSPETTGPTEYWYYNSASYLTSYKNLRGYTTTYTRDPSTNLVTGISYPDSSSESFTYTTFNEVYTHLRRNGHTEYYNYDTNGDGLLWKFQDATQTSSNLITYSYNAQYLVSAVQDAEGNTTSFQYNDEGQAATITHPDTTTQVFTYGPRLVSTVTNELGKKWTYTYDGFDRILTVQDPLTRTTTYTYDPNTPTNSKPLTVTLPTGKETKTAYTAAWIYEATSVTKAYGTSDASTTGYGYDPVGNVTSVTDPRTYVTSLGYDARNRVDQAQDPVGNTSSFYYDDDGNLTTMTTPDGSTYEQYEQMDRLKQSTDPKTQVTKFQYDPEGALQYYTDPNSNLYTYYYDGDERETKMLYPDSTTEQYSYDYVGDLLTYTTRDSKIETYQPYDNRNRPISASWSDGITPSTTWGFDHASRLTSLSNANSALSYVYDDANETSSETQNITGLGSKTFSYSYYTDGTLDTITYPDTTVLTYVYNNRNQISSIKQGSNTVVSYTYDAAGNRSGKNLANGVNSTLTYDTVERLISIQDITPSPTSGTLLQRFDYGYDGMSRFKYVKRNSALGDDYSYDSSGQLHQVLYNATNPDGTPTSPSDTATYNYDSAGNRTTLVDTLHGTTTYAVSAGARSNNNQYSTINGASLAYDTKGNLTGYGGWTYSYDAQNRLIQASDSPSLITQAFDPLGRCVKRVESGTTTYLTYDLGWNLLADYNGSGTLLNRYVTGENVDEPITLTNSSSQVYYYHTDGHGSVTKLTNSAGAIVEQYTYDVFGQPTITTSTGSVLTTSAYGNRFMFSGREYLSSLNLYDYRNRVYSGTLGRFLQPDPIGHAGDDYNLNRFCGNDPINYTDPFGTDEMAPITIYGNSEAAPSDGPLPPLAVDGGGANRAVNESSKNEKNAGVAVLNGVSGMAAGAKESSRAQNVGPDSSAKSATPTGGPDNSLFDNSVDFSPPDPDPTLVNFAKTMGESADIIGHASNDAMAIVPVGEVGLGLTIVSRLGSRAIDAAEIAINGETAATAAGRAAHAAYRLAEEDGINGIKEFRLPSGKRIDFLDISKGIIYELKPNNSRAIRAGQKQLQIYLQEIRTLPQFQGMNWKLVLETY